jgi:predicted transposase YbfD/YdcC
MQETPVATIAEHFGDLEDARADNVSHRLLDVIVIAICAVICGADTWVEVETFGNAKQGWLSRFLELPHGIPSHDTFGRVFGLLDADAFRDCFVDWVEAISDLMDGEVIAIDGKTLRRSYDGTIGKDAIELVGAWASDNRLVLGHEKVDDESNEITAIPPLLDLLALTGCIVTVDAIGCQTTIAEKIIDANADYVLTVKENQERLYGIIEDMFNDPDEMDAVDYDYHKAIDKGHGRIEIRECWTTSDPAYLRYIGEWADWKGLQSLVMVRSERRIGDKSTTESRYFISSLESDAELILAAVRTHWEIENKVHWVLDVAFREDESRVRQGNAAQNLSLLRHIALNLLKQEETAQCGTKAKRLKAGWDPDYLLKVLSG